jgi:hypothetical protein
LVVAADASMTGPATPNPAAFGRGGCPPMKPAAISSSEVCSRLRELSSVTIERAAALLE